MVKKFNNYMPADTDPEEAQRRADAWGVNIDDHVFADADEYLGADKQALTENEFGKEDVFDELDNGGALEQESIYAGHSLKEMIEVLRDAEAHNDKSTSFEVQAALQTYLEKAIEKGELTENGALNLIDQIDRMTKPGAASGEESPASADSAEGDTSRAISPEDIAKLQKTTKENWAKTPDTAAATTPESPARNPLPSAEDIDAARRASETAPATPSESDKAAAAEAASRASGDSEASTGEAEPNASEKETSKKERRMGKIRRGFNRALTWLMAETKDDEGSSESKSKTSGGSAGAVGGMRKGFNSFRDQWKEQRASKIDTAAAADVKAEAKDAPKPAEADKAAAAEAVKGAERTPDTTGDDAETAPDSGEKSATSEPEAEPAATVEDFKLPTREEIRAGDIKRAERRVKGTFAELRTQRMAQRTEVREKGAMTDTTRVALERAESQYQAARFFLDSMREADKQDQATNS